MTRLSQVYRSAGPFASVLLDVGRDTESGAREHELRVRSAAEELTRTGVPAGVVGAVTDRLGERVDIPAPVARVVVANDSGVVLDEVAHRRVDRPGATWGPLPDLTEWIRLVEWDLRFAVVLVDHEGGEIAVYNSAVPEPETETSAGGDTFHVHKVPVGGWSQLRIQRETENVWKRNANAVVADVESLIRQGIRLVLVAGDPRSTAQVFEGIGKSPATLVHLVSGGRSIDGGDDALQQAIREALMEYAVSQRVELVHRYKDQLGQEFAVATGVRDVADAFVNGQVDTLLLDPQASSGFDLVVQDHPGLDLGSAVPDGEPLRADQALLAAAARTDAEVAVLPQNALGGTPIAALLRWDNKSGG